MDQKPRIRRKSSAIKVGLSRSNTYGSSHHGDETDVDGVSSSQSIPNVPTSSLGTQLENLKTTVQKRITTWGYLRSAHEGKVFWFNTILLGQDELHAAFEPSKMRIRTTRFLILGMSLSALLDIQSPHDFLRGLLSLVQEFDSVTDDKFDLDRKNQRGLFRGTGKPKKGNTGGADFSMGLTEPGDTSYLFTPNIPFELDYFQVLFTACDLLVETYHKVLSYLTPATNPSFYSSTSPMYGGPGSQTPSTGAMSISGPFFQQQQQSQGSGLNGSVGGATLSPALADVVVKIDTRLTKIISQLTKDVDSVARRSIKTELQSLSAAFGGNLDINNPNLGGEVL